MLLAAALWLPALHLYYAKPAADFCQADGVSPKARQLAARHMELWSDPSLRKIELDILRASNAEWDFMGRSFLVWSLANLGLREPAMKPAYGVSCALFFRGSACSHPAAGGGIAGALVLAHPARLPTAMIKRESRLTWESLLFQQVSAQLMNIINLIDQKHDH